MKILKSLGTKILILISVPLVFQLSILAVVANLQDQAEAEARSADKARRFSDEVMDLIRDILALKSNFGEHDSIHLNPEMGSQYLTLKESIEGHFAALRELTKDNVDLSRRVNKTLSIVLTAQHQMAKARRAYRRAKLAGEEAPLDDYVKLRDTTMNFSQELLNLRDAGRNIAQASPEKQRILRTKIQNLLLAGSVANILFTLGLGFLLSRSIIHRLNIINENNFRLASNRPLHEPLRGEDEIAKVDHFFHKMAAEISSAISKEKIILESAHDCIAAFDENFKFLRVNAASQQIFDLEADEVLSSHFVDFLASEEKEKFSAFRQQLRNVNTSKPASFTIVRRDGSQRQVLLSLRKLQQDTADTQEAAGQRKSDEFIAVFHDITERYQAEQLKQEVVAMVTHDLRSPLMTIETFLEMLAQGAYNDESATEKYNRHLAGAKRSSKRMLVLIGDLLDIEKNKSGMLNNKPETLQAREILEAAIEESSGFAAEMGVSLKLRPGNASVKADPQMLPRIIANLLSNAIKFSPPGGTVTLQARTSGNSVIFSVEDQGPGLSPEDQNQIFERFQQVGNQTARTRGGSGLGLTICKEMVEIHGGKIWVESSKGEGSTFLFTIPRTS